jgi:hypothetical protein
MIMPTLARRRIRSRLSAVLAVAATALSLPLLPALSVLPAHAAAAATTATGPLGREWPSFSYYPPGNDFVTFGGHNATTTFGDPRPPEYRAWPVASNRRL